MNAFLLVVFLFGPTGEIGDQRFVAQYDDAETCLEHTQPALAASILTLSPEALSAYKQGIIHLETGCIMVSKS